MGLLSALALPLVAGTRQGHQFAVCANNLRQIGQGLLSFADAYGDKLPPLVVVPPGGSDGSRTTADWFRLASNYLASPRILTCPSSPRRGAASFEALSDANLSYLFGAHAGADRSWEILSGDFDMEGGTSAICSYIGNGVVTEFPGSVGMPDTYLSAWSGSNHVASGNLLFCDGSVMGGDSKYLRSSMADSAREGSRSVHLRSPK